MSSVYKRLVEHEGIRIGVEVPLLGRSVDLAIMLDDEVISVEFKLKNWRRAISQAKDHRLGADYAYICMPRERISAAVIEAVRKGGIGLLTVDTNEHWPFEVVVGAPRSKDVWPPAKQMVIDHLRRSTGSKLAPRELACA